jgi:type IV fimbrial biogenesis protein FimT
MKRPNLHPPLGISLWELLWVLTIAGALAGWAIPSFRGFLLDAQRTADINAFVLAVQLSRSEAAKTGLPVVLCKTVDHNACADRESRFDAGWMVFLNVDEIRPPNRAASEPLLYFHAPKMTGAITANRRLFEFRPFGSRSTNGTVTFCDNRGEQAARAVIVSYTGRPRVASEGPGGRILRCAHSS